VYLTIQVRPSSFLFLSIDPCSSVSHMFGSQSNVLIHCSSSSRSEGWP
jgi:hypothetical protein